MSAGERYAGQTQKERPPSNLLRVEHQDKLLLFIYSSVPPSFLLPNTYSASAVDRVLPTISAVEQQTVLESASALAGRRPGREGGEVDV